MALFARREFPVRQDESFVPSIRGRAREPHRNVAVVKAVVTARTKIAAKRSAIREGLVPYKEKRNGSRPRKQKQS